MIDGVQRGTRVDMLKVGEIEIVLEGVWGTLVEVGEVTVNTGRFEIHLDVGGRYDLFRLVTVEADPDQLVADRDAGTRRGKAGLNFVSIDTVGLLKPNNTFGRRQLLKGTLGQIESTAGDQ